MTTKENKQKEEKKSGGIMEYIRKHWHPFNPDWDKEEPEAETSEAGRS